MSAVDCCVPQSSAKGRCRPLFWLGGIMAETHMCPANPRGIWHHSRVWAASNVSLVIALWPSASACLCMVIPLVRLRTFRAAVGVWSNDRA